MNDERQTASIDSSTSRRALLLALGGGALSLAAFAATGTGSDPGSLLGDSGTSEGSASAPLASGTIWDWMAVQGSVFDISGAAMVLAGVEALPSEGARPDGLRGEGFLAVFDPADGASLPGDLIHGLSHGTGGAFEIFLSDAANPAHPGRMHAVFN